jgi:hypothetical protein
MKNEDLEKMYKKKLHNSSMALYGVAPPIILGQAHVIFAAIKSATFRGPNLRRKGLFGFGSTAIPMAGHTPNLSSSNIPRSHH